MSETDNISTEKQIIDAKVDTGHIVDLSDDSKEQKTRFKVMSTIKLGGGIFMRLISTSSGMFVDIRKFHIDHFTARGIRVPIIKFFQGTNQLRIEYNNSLK